VTLNQCCESANQCGSETASGILDQCGEPDQEIKKPKKNVNFAVGKNVFFGSTDLQAFKKQKHFFHADPNPQQCTKS
jgi:hypothetical protein